MIFASKHPLRRLSGLVTSRLGGTSPAKTGEEKMYDYDSAKSGEEMSRNPFSRAVVGST